MFVGFRKAKENNVCVKAKLTLLVARAMFYFQEQCLFFSCLCGDATRRLYSFWNIVNYVQCDGVCFVMFFKTVGRFGFFDFRTNQGLSVSV